MKILAGFERYSGIQFGIEKDHGFRLMIHDRDLKAGRTVRANIMDGIEKSRRITFIMSR